MVELGAVAFLDLGANLGAQAEDETPLGNLLEVIRLMASCIGLRGNAIATLVIKSRGLTVNANTSGVKTSRGPSKVNTLAAPASRSSAARSAASVGLNSAVMTFKALPLPGRRSSRRIQTDGAGR